MSQAVPPAGESSNPFQPLQKPKGKKDYFELRFETAVLAMYTSITGKHADTSKLEKGLQDVKEGKMTPQHFAKEINQVIDGLNADLKPHESPFPPFELTSENQNTALSYFALSFEKYINTLAEEGKMKFTRETPLFNETQKLWDQIEQGVFENNPQEAFGQLQNLIESLKHFVGGQYQFPDVPSYLITGK